MSTASFIAALGVAENVVRFVDFGMKLCRRIEEYSGTAGAPKELVARINCLSYLLEVLHSLSEAEQEALESDSVFHCIEAANELSDLLNTFIDRDRHKKSKRKYLKRAWKYLHSEQKVEGLQKALDSLLVPLSLHLQAKTARQTLALNYQTEQILLQQAMRTSSNAHRKPATEDCIKTIAIIPIARNPGFVGREWQLDILDEHLSPKLCGQLKASLYGLGGVGKSQIALEYAYRFLERFSECSVFWVLATDAARFEEAYRRIAFECEIPGREDPKGDLMQLVRNWLESKYKGIWLMVVDNVDDISVFSAKNSFGKSLSEYIPQSPKGSILYTTRDRRIGANLVPPRGLINVSRMSLTEAQNLLGEKVLCKSTEEEQYELLEGLDYLPLAISQAAAFMTALGLTISQYLVHYRYSYSARTRLLGYKFADHGREERPMESVATTWMISFSYIQKQNPRAADLLALMSFLDRQEIPKSLLICKGEDPLDFSEAVGLLDAFSLIATNHRRDNYRIHRLVQLATRVWLTTDGEGEKKASLALELVAGCFPDGDYEHWATCEVYLPHAEAVLHSGYEEYPNANTKARATILFNTSWYFRSRGKFEAAEARAWMSFRLRQEILGDNHPDTLASMSNLASVLHDRGKYKAAEEMNRQALQAREKELGKDDPETLVSFSNLASVLQDQGRHKEAEDINRKALKLHEKVRGDRHPDTLASLSNLALVLQQQGKFEEAEEMHRRALEGSQKVLGEEHPDTLVSIHNLAEFFCDQGLYEEAEKMHRRALKGGENVLGKEHPFTLTSLHNLAEVLRYRGKYDEAEETHRRALEGSQKVLGSVHPYTLTSLHNLAELLRDREKHVKAEEMTSGFGVELILPRKGMIESRGGVHFYTADEAVLTAEKLHRYSEDELMSVKSPDAMDRTSR